LNWFDNKVNQFQALSKSVSKSLSVKELIETIKQQVLFPVLCVEPSGVQALKNPNPLKDVEALVVLVVAVLF